MIYFFGATTAHLLAQLTFPHLPHCQSSAEKSPLDFSAAALPISVPSILTFPPASMISPSAPAPSGPPPPPPDPEEEEDGRSVPHRLHWLRRAKLTLPQLQ